jgi:predicted acyltransferase
MMIEPKTAKERNLSLDVFRGITVAAMILVNNPGSWDSVYEPLLHAHWNGCTPTDLIFPFFLFIVGVSIHFAFAPIARKGLTRPIFIKILKRTIIIFALGIFLAWFPVFSLDRLSRLRVPGVLQRISIVFFCSSILYLSSHWVTQIRVTALLLVGYFIVMTVVPVPGLGAANLEPETNFGAWLDRLLLNGHLWAQSKTWDPEGVLSTLPAIATCVLGTLSGRLITSARQASENVIWLFFIGAMLIVSGLAWGLFFPINKALWTSSYVLYTSGIAMQFLAALYWFIDVQGFKKWTAPFVYYGTNAIFVFVTSGMLAKTLLRIKIDGEGKVSLWSYLYQNLYASWLAPKDASLLFALTLLALFLIILWQMHKRKIVVKV